MADIRNSGFDYSLTRHKELTADEERALAERIRQIETDALAKLRDRLQEPKPFLG